MISKIFHPRSNFEDNEDILLFWQKKIFNYLFSTLLIVGIVPYILSIHYAVKLSQWHLVIIFTLIYAAGFAIVFLKKIPFNLRVWAGLIVFYILGVNSLLTSGLAGSARLYLLCFCAFSVLFFNLKYGLITLFINILTLISFGLLFASKLFLPENMTGVFRPEEWIIITATFSFLCATVTISLSVLIRALEVNSKEFKHLIKNTSQVIWTLNNDLLITFVNAPLFKILGYRQKEWIGLPLNQFLNENDSRIFRSMIKKNNAFSFEATLLHKNGDLVPVKISGTKISELNDSKNVYQGSIEDIREQKKHEQERFELIKKLHQAEKLKSLGILAGSVAHDLNNILSGIATYPEVLLMDSKIDPAVEKGLKIIRDSGQKAAAVVSDLLTISRGAQSSDKEIINLNALLERYTTAHDFNKVKATYPNVTIEIITEPELLNIQGSYIHIEKSIMNLVINAVEEVAAKPDGRVLISTANVFLDSVIPGHENRIQGEYVVLSVTDNGSGISKKDREKIFDPFYTRKEMGKSGTGLGLTIVWNAIQDHMGYIDVESGPTGTTFDLIFPATREEIKRTIPSGSIDEIKGNGQMILVVDDLEDQQEIAVSILKNLGYQAKSVDNGYDAVEFIRSNPTDLVILDMIMAPSISGLETYRLIKKINPAQKAIIASGYAESDDVQSAQQLGAGSFVKKPYTILDMGIAIKEELEK